MAREGIYIGGKEILERYVGNKLVWKKIKEREVANFIETEFDDNVYYWFYRRTNNRMEINLPSLSFEFGTYTNVYIRRNNKIYQPSKIEIKQDTGQSVIYVTFNNEQELNRFRTDVRSKGYSVSIIERK